ncbi:unnamed protein product, partial [Meganyctiphanes norvegica]
HTEVKWKQCKCCGNWFTLSGFDKHRVASCSFDYGMKTHTGVKLKQYSPGEEVVTKQVKQRADFIKSESDHCMGDKIEEHPINTELRDIVVNKMDLQIKHKEEVNVIKNEHGLYLDVKIEEHPIKVERTLFICSVCGLRFAQKSYLDKHTIKHTGEKPYQCS